MITIRIGGTERTEPFHALSIEVLIMAQAALQLLVKQIEENKQQVPQSLADELDACTRQLNRKQKDALQHRLKLLDAERQHVLPAEQKLAEIDAERTRIQQLLQQT